MSAIDAAFLEDDSSPYGTHCASSWSGAVATRVQSSDIVQDGDEEHRQAWNSRSSDEQDGAMCVLTLDGEVDVYTAPSLKEKLVDDIEQGCSNVIVDMEHVDVHRQLRSRRAGERAAPCSRAGRQLCASCALATTS